MRIRFFFDGKDSRGMALAKRLVEETEAEVVHSEGMAPTLWVEGCCYYGLERIEEQVTHLVPALPEGGESRV